MGHGVQLGQGGGQGRSRLRWLQRPLLRADPQSQQRALALRPSGTSHRRCVGAQRWTRAAGAGRLPARTGAPLFPARTRTFPPWQGQALLWGIFTEGHGSIVLIVQSEVDQAKLQKQRAR